MGWLALAILKLSQTSGTQLINNFGKNRYDQKIYAVLIS
jgi:hypothetical protein